MNFTAFESRFQTHLLQAVASPRRRSAADRRDVERDRRFASAAGRTASTAASTTRARSTGASVELQLAGDDARDVEDVLDELRLRCALRSMVSSARWRTSRRRAGRRAASRPSRGWRQRRAQLVRERGQELVLGAVGVLRLAIEPRVVDRVAARRASSTAVRQVVVVVAAFGSTTTRTKSRRAYRPPTASGTIIIRLRAEARG